jgi:peptide deformylase
MNPSTEKLTLADYLAYLCEGNRLFFSPGTDPALHQPAKAVAVENIPAEVLPWVGFIRDAIVERKAAAIAAPQVGIPFAFFVSKIKGIPLAINPRVTAKYGNRVSKPEGSLTWPGRTTYMARHEHITAQWTAKDGNEYVKSLHDFEARIFQHMCDALAGVVLFP